MAFAHQLRRLTFAVMTGATLVIGVLSAPIVFGALTPAAAQISDDAQIALEQYGSWRPHPRFGEVWVPAAVPPDWRPYQYGHWVYTDEWGWYWVSDDVEADWGWVVYHYGRWAFEPGFGWYWVPGDEWGPAWVNWRYGDQYAGWAPLPPDELIETYELQPAYWVFVPTRFIAAPRWRSYSVPPYRRSVILRETRIVNRTVPVHGRLAVNPGISPAFVARVSGAPVATYRVRPRVFASTQGVAGAVQVRREDLRDARGGRPGGPPGPGRPGTPGGPARLGAISVERTSTVIKPNAAITAPQPLGKNERGRLGTDPPRAAQGAPSVAPLQQQPPPGSTAPPSGVQRQAPAIQQQPAGASPPASPPPSGTPPATSAPTTTAPPASPPPSGTPPATTAPTTTAPVERREEHRDRVGPGGPAGGPPPQQPNIVRPTPPQAPPPPAPPPPQPQRQVQPPPPPAPPQLQQQQLQQRQLQQQQLQQRQQQQQQQQQRQVQPPPPPPQRQVQPPPPPPQRQVQPPPAARPPGPPPGARPPGPPPQGPGAPPPQKKPPPKPGEKPPEPPK
jgi:hypothetical protein